MKKCLTHILFLSLLVTLFTACSTNNQVLKSNYKVNVQSKNNYLQKANNNDINAMHDLNKYHNFVYTKEGLEQHKKWYDKIILSDNLDLVNNYAKLMIENHNYFINYEYKISNLLNKLPNNKAKYLITKVDFYSKIYNGPKKDNILENAYDTLEENELHELLNFYANSTYRLNKDHYKIIEELVKNKSYKTPMFIHYYKMTNYKYSKEEKELYLQKVLNLDEETILAVAKITAHNRYAKQATKLYEKAVSLNTKNKEAYYYLGLREKRHIYNKEKKEKAIKYFEKAMDLGSKEAAAFLIKTFSNDKKYLDKYVALKDRFSLDDKTLLLYINELLKRAGLKKAKGILKELEKRGNKEALILLALEQRLYRYDVEEELKTKAYQEKILNSNNKYLINKYYQKMKSNRYRYKFKKEIEEYVTKEAQRGNLKEIRYLIKYTKLPKEEKRKWLISAYKNGDNYAAHNLALDYLSSRGLFELNEQKAKDVYEDLISQNDIKAILDLASSYTYGKNKDIKKSIYYYEKAAKFNSFVAFKNLASYYTCGPCNDSKKADYNKALKYVKYLAKKEDPSNMATLGWFYNLGVAGLPKDYKKAIYWYEKAAKKDSKTALRNLGLIYKDGNKDIPKDYKKAIYYLEKAERKYSLEAANDLGTIYQDNKDYEKAIYWYKKATVVRNPTAFNNLAYLYMNGVGVKKDYIKAKELYEQSVFYGNAEANNELGVLYYQGWGVKKDYKKAREYFLKALVSNKDRANYNLGLLYELGLGVKKDINKAISYYKNSNSDAAKKRIAKLK